MRQLSGVILRRTIPGLLRDFTGSTDADYVRVAGEVSEATQGRGVNLVFDTVGNPLFEAGLHSLAQRGRQVCIASTAGPQVSFNLVDFYHKEAVLKGVDSLKLSFKESGDILRELAKWIGDAKVMPPPVHVIALEEAPAAYAGIFEGAIREKQVIRF